MSKARHGIVRKKAKKKNVYRVLRSRHGSTGGSHILPFVFSIAKKNPAAGQTLFAMHKEGIADAVRDAKARRA